MLRADLQCRVRRVFFFSSRRRHTRFKCDWSSDVCSSDLSLAATLGPIGHVAYTAGNIYQDAYAEAGNPGYPVISIQWTNMKDVGMSIPAVKHKTPAEQEEIRSEERRVGEEGRSRWSPYH